MGKIISIVNQKGGVGKTTVACNLSAGLVIKGKNVLLVDLDSQASTTSYFNLESDELKKTIGNLLLSECKVNDIIYTKEGLNSNYDLLPSNIGLQDAEIRLVSLNHPEQRLKTHLKKVKDDYDYILIDCPPHIGILTANALIASDYNILVVNPSIFSLEGISKLTRRMKDLSEFEDRDLTISRVLLNRCKLQTVVYKTVSEQLVDIFGPKMFNIRVRENTKIEEAFIHKEPVLSYDEKCIGSKDFSYLISEFLMWQGDHSE